MKLDEFYRVHQGDARHLVRLLDLVREPNGSPLTCTITSPPYAQLKDYGHPDQIGWGQPYDEYLVEMRRVFRQLYHHTKLDGSLWLIADTLKSDGPTSLDLPQRLQMLPFELADQAGDAGWILREVIVWQKDKTLPWSSGRRLRNSFEYVLLLVKSSEYKFRSERLRQTENLSDWWVKWPERYNPNGKVPTNVWDIPIPVQGSWRESAFQHACPLPPDLVERLVLLSSDEGDVVFDPFAGTGVVVAEAERLQRRGLGIELNKTYATAYGKVRAQVLSRRPASLGVSDSQSRVETLRQDILYLRALKYPKVLFQGLSKDTEMPSPKFLLSQITPIKPDTLTDASKPLVVKTVFVFEDTTEDIDHIERKIKDVANRAPATKFGIAGEVIACRLADVSLHLRRGKQWVYTGGRTWAAERRVLPRELDDLRRPSMGRRGTHNYPPIVANIEVQLDPGDT